MKWYEEILSFNGLPLADTSARKQIESIIERIENIEIKMEELKLTSINKNSTNNIKK